MARRATKRRRALAGVATLIVLSAAGTAGAGASHTADEAAIIEVEHGLARAQTLTEAMKFYEPDRALVLYDSQTPDVFHGFAAVSKNFAAQLAGMKSFKVEFEELRVGSEGTLGYAFSLQHVTITKKDNTVLELRLRDTDILHKIGGRWLIAHQHLSYPADLRTGKAVFNEHASP